MKILFITHQFPFPATTGNAHVAYRQIIGLAKRHAVDLVSFSDRKVTQVGELDRCADIEIVERSRPISIFNKLLALASTTPQDVAYFRHPKMAQAVGRRLSTGDYDAAVFHMSVMGQYLPLQHGGPAFWSLEDPTVIKERRQLRWAAPHAKIAAYQRIARYGRYERAHARHFDKVLLINEADARDYAEYLGSSNVDWVPYGVDTGYFSPSPDVPRREGMIVMTGNMYHPPNVVAVEWFCDRVFPLITKRYPGAELWLVGANPSPRVKRRARAGRVFVTGSVPDIRLYQRQARVGICPVQLAVGTQTKVLEAMSCGTPVVTTSAGNHGVGGVSGTHLHVADDPGSFADKVVRLLNNEHWRSLSEDGRGHVERHFRWEASVSRLERMFEQALAARAARTA